MSKSKENKNLLTVSAVLEPYEQMLVNFSEKEPLKAKLIDTPLGQMLAISHDTYDQIVFLMFIESRHFDRELKNLIKRYSTQIVDGADDDKPFQAVESEVNAYFRGELTKFVKTRATICSSETEFIRSVWDELVKIDYGETTTFSELAKRIGKPNGAQPVANATSRNHLSLIIPCHRIMSAGKTSVNNSCIERRNWLLDHEKKHAPKNTHTDANHTI